MKSPAAFSLKNGQALLVLQTNLFWCSQDVYPEIGTIMLKHAWPGLIFVLFFWLWIQFHHEKVKTTAADRETEMQRRTNSYDKAWHRQMPTCGWNIFFSILFLYMYLYLNCNSGSKYCIKMLSSITPASELTLACSVCYMGKSCSTCLLTSVRRW